MKQRQSHQSTSLLTPRHYCAETSKETFCTVFLFIQDQAAKDYYLICFSLYLTFIYFYFKTSDNVSKYTKHKTVAVPTVISQSAKNVLLCLLYIIPATSAKITTIKVIGSLLLPSQHWKSDKSQPVWHLSFIWQKNRIKCRIGFCGEYLH